MTTLEEATAAIKALTGVTDDDRDTQRRVNTRNAARRGRHCAECGVEFAPDEPVWRFRKIVGRFFGYCYSFAPHCASCASNDWHHFHRPRPCAGCGRPVHSTTPSWQLSRILCCEECGHKARAARDRGARAEARGTRDCESCSKTFTPTRTDSKFCCVACKQKAYRRARHEQA
jgi:hypothetical protein